MSAPDTTDEQYLERAVDLARSARERGDHPFGALIVTAGGTVIEGRNSVMTGHDPTGHAEMNAVRAAGTQLGAVEFAAATLYASTEPCVMCAGAAYWAGIGRVVYAFGSDALIALVDEGDDAPSMSLHSREVFARGSRAIEVVGPVDVPGARAVHQGFWTGG
ncbi:nucleoside deaminase [Microbacterium sp. RD1]|uniref:nucleoside deaminase n=1 Tax=Microbacterium sp. RD1 TaxID=3457313 RepID=UPI003FA5438F